MDPISSAALSIISEQILGRLSNAAKDKLASKRSVARIAKSVSEASNDAGIKISARALRKWLRRDDVQDQLFAGASVAIESAIESLAVIVEKQTPSNRKESAKSVLFYTFQAYQRELPLKEGILVGNEWLKNTYSNESQETRNEITNSKVEILKEIQSTTHIDKALQSLHPWRREDGKNLLSQWPKLGELVLALTEQTDRRSVLEDWGLNPPKQLTDGPAVAWTWFALLAEDYGAPGAAINFLTQAANSGVVKSDYWLGRAMLLLEPLSIDSYVTLKDRFPNIQVKHALPIALLKIIEDDVTQAKGILDKWETESANDYALKTVLIAKCLTSMGDVNSSVSLLNEAISQDMDADSLILTAVRTLIWRSMQTKSENRSNDLLQAGELAILSRNRRRSWLGDSAESSLEAIHAYMLCNDSDRAWRIANVAPDGDASYRESKDLRIQLEASLISASKGDWKEAKTIALQANNNFAVHYIEGWKRFSDDQIETANEQWYEAFKSAKTDFDGLRAISALSSTGANLPDLGDLGKKFPEAIRQFRELQNIMSSPVVEVAELRANLGKSEFLDFHLAEQIEKHDEPLQAAQLLEAAAAKWQSPQLMIKSAKLFLRLGDYKQSEALAREAVNMSVPNSSGEQQAMFIQFESLEHLDLPEESLGVARRMVTNNPSDLDARWTLVHRLAREGLYQQAWNILNADGTPTDPRSHYDAKLWIILSTRFDQRPTLVSSVLRLIEEREYDSELVGILLANTVLSAHKAPKEDIDRLQSTFASYTKSFPNNGVIKSFTFDSSEEFLKDVRDLVRSTRPHKESLEKEDLVSKGELPLGFLTLMYGKSYVEACIVRGAGRVFSFRSSQTVDASAQASATLNKHVVLDATSAVTLALLPGDLQDKLFGKFSVLKTTTAIYKDAVDAQVSFNRRSTMSLGWDQERDDIFIHSIPDEKAEEYIHHCSKTIKILERLHRKSWTKISSIEKDLPPFTWLSALDFAIANNNAFWCDDSSLRSLAAHFDVPTFGTVDLLRHLYSTSELTLDELEFAEALLISNYHVDLEPPLETWLKAAAADSWKPVGSVSYLSLASTWTRPEVVFLFIKEFANNINIGLENDFSTVLAHAARGIMEFSGQSREKLIALLQILICWLLTELRPRLDLLSSALDGVRIALDSSCDVGEVLEASLRRIRMHWIQLNGEPITRNRIIDIIRNLNDADKKIGYRILIEPLP
ncbi:tetratricopeptide repeat protein [Glutamicibacter sp. X7]